MKIDKDAEMWGVVNPRTLIIVFKGTQPVCREFMSRTDPNYFICYCPKGIKGKKLYT